MSSHAALSVESQDRIRRGVKAVITASERVLVVREMHDDGSTFWTFPGGGVETGESKAVALKRELLEELGCKVAVGDKRGSVWYAHSCQERVSKYTAFDCTLLSFPKPNLVDGILEYRWMKRENLGQKTLPLVPYVLEEMAGDP